MHLFNYTPAPDFPNALKVVITDATDNRNEQLVRVSNFLGHVPLKF